MQHEYIFRIFGKESHKQITANLDLLLRRFNEVTNFFTLFARYYECISSLDCILIGLKVNSSLSVIMISSFRSSFGSKHRFFSLNISTSGFISWKSSSSWPHSKWFLKEIFNWMSKVIWDYVDFNSTSPCDWSGKLASPSQPIRCKAKINRDLVTRIFPRFWSLVLTRTYDWALV